ncbi:PEK protein kinase [Phytophthora cinnamomi]|uniref:PEK protein kinase n=1 Tax=Phytophthora cinnamomi TaxID=4785 RepID=UPI00355970B0|nr:PEK protein kinase [Phytophthora cinnamomi]
MLRPSKIPSRVDKKRDSTTPPKPWQSPVILPLARCLSTPVQNGKPIQPQSSMTPPPPQRRQERPGERSGSGLFEKSSPFETDFTEKELIAQGGFGKVYKCKSNTDGHWYAVKLEQFWFKPETYFNPSEVRDVMMNEALVLAGLDHENVCRYYNTWVLGSLIPAVNKGQEVEQPESPCYSPTYTLTRRTSSPAGSSSPTGRSSFSSVSDIGGEDDEVDMSSSNYSDAYSFDPDEEGVASFGDLGFEMEAAEDDERDISPRISLARSQRLAAGENSPQRINEDGDDTFNRQQRTERPRPKPLDSSASTPGAFITQIDVYIQMSLYEGNSLRDWMEQRKSGEIDTVKNMHIFHQIVNGLRYVHKQGLVHRDVKPANIFLTRESCVKIGDFGLSKNTLQTSLNLHPSRYLCEEGDDSFDTLTYNSTDEEMEEVSELSVGVGTPLYSSPEQTHGHQTCAAPSDVFSLGVLLCELFCTFTTQMERYVVLSNARKGQLPPSLLDEHPQIAELICAMVQEDPLLRPTCADIMDCGIFQHQKLHFNLRSPCSGSVGVSPLARALLSHGNCSSTVLNLLRSIARLEQEEETLLLSLETTDKHKIQVFSQTMVCVRWRACRKARSPLCRNCESLLLDKYHHSVH